MRKPTLCICENKDADQLRGNREADQGLGFRICKSRFLTTLLLFKTCLLLKKGIFFQNKQVLDKDFDDKGFFVVNSL